MHVVLRRKDDAFHMEATSDGGHLVQIDGSAAIGAREQGARPMELILMGLGGCSGIDVISILKKQRQELRDLTITVDGERDPNETPSVFRKIRVHFAATGELDADRLRHAVGLSMEKYCSVAKMLEKTAEITHAFSLNGVEQPESHS